MKVIGVGISDDVVKQVQVEIDQIFSGMPAHWKKDLFRESVVEVVPQSDFENMGLVDTQEGRFVVSFDKESGADLQIENIGNSVVIMYLRTFIDLDAVVEPIVNEVMSAFGIDHGDRLFALVLWFREEGFPGLTNRSDAACEEIDRRLAGLLYVLRVSVDHGLSIQ